VTRVLRAAVDVEEKEEEPEREIVWAEIERVDAVDRPATGRKWLIVKGEEGGETMQLSDFETIVRAALNQLYAESQSGRIRLSEQAAQALNAIVALVGETDTLFAAAEEQEEEPEAAEPEAKAEEQAAESEDELTEMQVEAAVTKEEEPAAQQSEGAAEKAEQEGYGYGYPDVQVFALMLAELRAIRQLLEQIQTKQASVQKSAPPPSRQIEPVVPETHRPKKWGEGLFADVLFG